MSEFKRILLIEPDFPYPNKSKHKTNTAHKNFVPIGLLKFGSFHKKKGNFVKLVRGKASKRQIRFTPDEILVTSLFTYWSDIVWDTIEHYRSLYPNSKIKLGGIYATLHMTKDKFKQKAKELNVKVYSGVIPSVERCLPDYSLIGDSEYHATHMMRGCIRKCAFCGTWRIEPELMYKDSKKILNEISQVGKNKIIFYDNNILANPHIKDILIAFSEFRLDEKRLELECQSGFDGRLLLKDPDLAKLIKSAGFRNVRIAWDNSLADKDSIKKQLDLLIETGYNPKDITVFMIYNFVLKYEDMLKKVDYCKKWGVQIADCRNRPLNLDYDNYNPRKINGQPDGSFYVHEQSGWSDRKIRNFRKKCRQHNIEIRYALHKGQKYDKKMEKWSAIHNMFKFFNLGRPPQMSIIENHDKTKKQIDCLKRLMNYHKKFDIPAPDLSGLSQTKLNRLLKPFEKDIAEHQHMTKKEFIQRINTSTMNDTGVFSCNH
ncbi:MAG: radical SAM protein [Candidatus Woesearchaeota archaeon]